MNSSSFFIILSQFLVYTCVVWVLLEVFLSNLFLFYFKIFVFLSKVRGVTPLFAVLRLLSEGSTPFVNIRYLLAVFGKQNTKLYLYNGYLLIMSFFIFRITLILPFWMHGYPFLFDTFWQTLDYICFSGNAVACLLLDILNIFWFKKLLLGALKYRKDCKKSS